jgi:hypothetical protein
VPCIVSHILRRLSPERGQIMIDLVEEIFHNDRVVLLRILKPYVEPRWWVSATLLPVRFRCRVKVSRSSGD